MLEFFFFFSVSESIEVLQSDKKSRKLEQQIHMVHISRKEVLKLKYIYVGFWKGPFGILLVAAELIKIFIFQQLIFLSKVIHVGPFFYFVHKMIYADGTS